MYFRTQVNDLYKAYLMVSCGHKNLAGQHFCMCEKGPCNGYVKIMVSISRLLVILSSLTKTVTRFLTRWMDLDVVMRLILLLRYLLLGLKKLLSHFFYHLNLIKSFYQAIGAISCMIKRPSDGKLIGYNIDYLGAIAAIEERLHGFYICFCIFFADIEEGLYKALVYL